RFRKSRSEVRANKPAGLRRRLHERHFLSLEKRIRHSAQARSRCDRAPQTDAGTPQAGPEKFEKSGKALRAACDPMGALHRSAFERQSDGARCRSFTELS